MDFFVCLVVLSILCYVPTINTSSLIELQLMFFSDTPRTITGMCASILRIIKFILIGMFVLMRPAFYIRRKTLSDSSILGTPLEQFNSAPWFTLIASIPQPDSNVPSSSALSYNSTDSSSNNNFGFSLSSPIASQDRISSPSEQQLDVLPTIDPSQPPGRTHP